MMAVFVANTAVVMLAVMIHYECLVRLNFWLPRMKIWPRFRIAVCVLGIWVAHAIEVWCFGLAYYVMIHSTDWGTLSGQSDGSVFDCVYFSFITYTTVGFGDIAPLGHLKFLCGVEALTGLILITWSASFMFLEMQKYWQLPATRHEPRHRTHGS